MNITPRTVTIKILSEVKVKLIGLHGDHLQQLYDRYGIPTANYFHHPKFKLGQWDGKIRFFNKSGETYLYLIEEILPYLKRVGYSIKLDDARETAAYRPDDITDQIFAHILHPDTQEPIILRDYQIEGVNKLIDAGFGLCVAGTGAGKTFMCAALVTAYDPLINKSITIVPDQSLIRQTKRDYINCQLDTGEYSGKEKSLHHKHIVSTWQALQHNPDLIHQFDMVIVDECLDGTTLIRMADGTTKQIKDVEVADMILSYNTQTQQYELDKVIKLHQNLTVSTSEKMYLLEFDNGQQLRVTGNHKILTSVGMIRADMLTDEHDILGWIDGDA